MKPEVTIAVFRHHRRRRAWKLWEFAFPALHEKSNVERPNGIVLYGDAGNANLSCKVVECCFDRTQSRSCTKGHRYREQRWADEDVCRIRRFDRKGALTTGEV